MNSKAKGSRGEREAAKAWSAVFGVEARRGVQYQGGTDSPDIVTGMADVHVEVKRTERGNPYAWIRQAAGDADDKVPVVLHRRNGQPWLMMLRLHDAPRLAEIVTAAAEELGRQEISGGFSSTGDPPPEEEDE